MRKIVVVAPIILMALVVLSAISDGAEKEPYEIHFTPNEKYEGWIEYELEKPLNKKRALEKGNQIMRTAKKDFTTIGIYRKNEKLCNRRLCSNWSVATVFRYSIVVPVM